MALISVLLTETPEIMSTPTLVPTLSKPLVQSGQVLIPVTGADLYAEKNSQSSSAGRLLSLIGFMTIGLGMVIQGFSKK